MRSTGPGAGCAMVVHVPAEARWLTITPAANVGARSRGRTRREAMGDFIRWVPTRDDSPRSMLTYDRRSARDGGAARAFSRRASECSRCVLQGEGAALRGRGYN